MIRASVPVMQALHRDALRLHLPLRLSSHGHEVFSHYE
ncbi:hypothetical protein BSIN_4121 [Burkholderia singularis]|uniref:Uncharacterized protein n=1 Tax=Burkholderia singularis TaxID=1503053 RepID=A0A238HBP9_9BURK|nr:hypothetical protein BSIN_4121 [Burkholderia singularis]